MNVLRGFSKAILLLSLFYFAALLHLPAAEAMTGSGTTADPFIITTPGDLDAVRNNLTASYKLANNIDLNGITWTPITGFKGNLDGNGYGIKNLTSTTRGLFYSIAGTASTHATIKNLTLTVKSINTSLSSVGGLVGSGSYLDISKVAVLNADGGTGINSTNTYIGGILGTSGTSTTITDSYAILPVNSSSDAGGLVGHINTSPTITRCYFAGTVTGESSINGLAGTAAFTSSYYDSIVAGIAPVDKAQMKLTSGMVHQATFTGWDFTNIWAIDEGSSYPYLRNLEKPVNVTSINTGDVTSGAGTSADPYIITTAQQLNNIRYDIYSFYKLGYDIDLGSTMWTPVPDFHGNLDGNGYGIKNLTSTTKGLFDTVKGTASTHAIIKNLSLTISSVNTSSSTVGGLVGNSSYLDISEVAVLNADSGAGVNASKTNIGGIIGSSGTATTITDSYAILPVNGSSYVGGLVGSTSTSPIITRCYFAGTITGDSSVYGLAGSATFTSSYYNGVVAGIDPVDKAYMKLTSGMTHQVNYTGWDFTNTWAIDEGSSYPYLRNLEKPINVTSINTGDVPSGAGTSAEPYIITTAQQLNNIRYDIYSFYKLGYDIDLGSTMWTPVPDFHGNLDGNGYGIKNLTSTTKGLFDTVKGTASTHAIIKNLSLTISSVNTSSSTVGGLVGNSSYLDISEVAVLNADSGAGVNASKTNIGGIIGSSGTATTITDSYAILPVNGSSYVGGLVGSTSTSPIITRCYFAGTITGDSSVYGLAGSATFTSSYYDGVVAGIAPVDKTQMKLTSGMTYQVNYTGWDFTNTWAIDEGGSYPYLLKLEKPINVTSIDTSDVPAWAGTSADPYVITTAQQLNNIRYDIYAFYKLGNDIDLSGTMWTSIPDFHGNFDGNGYGIENLTSTTKGLFDSVTGTSSTHAVIKNLKLTIQSIDTSLSTVGGLVGSSSYLDISEVAVLDADSGTGINASKTNIGGILGSSGTATTIIDSYAILPVNGSSKVGGLVGYTSTSPIITRCYFAGTVAGDSSVYGLAGSATYTSSYYDSTVAGISTGTGAKTTEEMKQKATFIGWDFDNLWNIDEGVTYPYLWSDTAPGTNSYIITTAQQLNDIRDDIYASYQLGNDIDLGGTTWTPIPRFHGNFDGNGYSIKNLTSTTKGLFDSVTGTSRAHATIKDLTITVNSINTSSSTVGGLVGSSSYLDISEVAVLNANSGTGINTNKTNIGGILGSAGTSTTITDSYAILPVNGSSKVGGLVGYTSTSPIITRCYFAGTVTGNSSIYGLAGSANFTSTYYDGVVAGINPVDKAQMKLTSGMTHQAIYTGWDFTNTWAIDEGSSYPYLRKFEKPVNVTIINISDVPSGAGTSADPYIIATAQQLNNIRYDIYAFYKLGNDIDLNSTTWTSIPDFHGNFDGNGYGIKNLTSTTKGFFDSVKGKASNHAIIKNLTLTIKLVNTSANNVGGLVGSGSYLDISKGAVLNADSGTGINSSSSNIGGIIGNAGSNTTMTDSYAILPVNGSSYVGGLVGYTSTNPIITRCYSAGTVTGNSSVYGLTDSATFTSSYYNGVVAGIDPADKAQMKLTSGMTHEAIYIGWDFTNTWAIDEGSSYPYLRNLEKPVNVTSINTSDVPSGTGTSADPYIITTAQQLNNIRYDIYAFYKLGNDIDLDNTTWTSVPDFHGNFDGNGYIIKNLTSITRGLFDSVKGTSSNHAIIKNLTLTVKSVDTSLSSVGGLVGNGSYFNISVVAVLNADSGTGINSSSSKIGGIIGSAGSTSTITDSYAILPLNGYGHVGGLAGYINTSTSPRPVITRCYFAGTVAGNSSVYGLADGATFISSYYDSTVAGISTGTGAKTTEEMKQQATFVGWDFVHIWYMDEGVIRCSPLSRQIFG
ncbi:hypothetical protein L9W92_12335 [Pelotomaculum terephthalicicum JT]|uniref:GLUG motif-containing protein n=1 Tax=Pelotomaculum terephthalicicum TaxID=206393 RepID=UPI001F03AF0A|nr:GLUG motif-containing protein [Pelotomaculum terephthalicicum]MCG9968826.1 hypothetical protein [Pelotomaculum terephthalicicum JT]